jgi:hypothetical protein
VFWLYGCLGIVGFFVIYWTFSETEGRSLEEIEEFYKKGMRGKIPKREVTDGKSKEPSINFSPSTSSVVIEKENEINTNDVDRVVNNKSLTAQSSRNTLSKLYSGNDERDGSGRSTETLDTAFTASTADIHDPKSSAADVRSVDEIQKAAEEEPEETKHKEEECKKVAEQEISDEVKECDEISKGPKAVEVKCSEAKTTNEGVNTEGENCIKGKMGVHNEDVEERTKM